MGSSEGSPASRVLRVGHVGIVHITKLLVAQSWAAKRVNREGYVLKGGGGVA